MGVSPLDDFKKVSSKVSTDFRRTQYLRLGVKLPETGELRKTRADPMRETSGLPNAARNRILNSVELSRRKLEYHVADIKCAS